MRKKAAPNRSAAVTRKSASAKSKSSSGKSRPKTVLTKTTDDVYNYLHAINTQTLWRMEYEKIEGVAKTTNNIVATLNRINQDLGALTNLVNTTAGQVSDFRQRGLNKLENIEKVVIQILNKTSNP